MKISIAIADDHVLFRENFSELIGCLGYEVVAKAKDGKELLNQLAGLTTLPDVCIVDGNMPVLNGTETTRAIKQKYNSMIVIVYTMNTRRSIEKEVLDAGADYFILKENFTELKSTLKSLESNQADQRLEKY